MGGVSLPGGKSLYGSLSADFVEFVPLIDDVENRDLTGYVAVEAGDELRGVFVFSDGDPVGGVYNGVVFEPEEVRDSDLGELFDDDSRIRAVSLEQDLTAGVEASVLGDSVHKGLHTDYVDPRGFLDDLRDEGFMGSVVLNSDDSETYGAVHLTDGEPFSSVIQTSDETLEGVGGVVEVIDDDSNDVLLDVYDYDGFEVFDDSNEAADATDVSEPTATEDYGRGYGYRRTVDAVRDSLSDVSGDIPFMTSLEEYVEKNGIEGVEVDDDSVVVESEADADRVSDAVSQAIDSTEKLLRVTQQNLEDGEVRERALEAIRREAEGGSNEAAEEILDGIAETEG
ncbi:hypothetical protein ACEU6E_07620 [Halorutilales archaeon Cl-col2-1]